MWPSTETVAAAPFLRPPPSLISLTASSHPERLTARRLPACLQHVLACAVQYWVVLLLPMPFMLLVLVVVRWHVLWRLSWLECLNLANECEIAWTHANTLSFPAICIFVGVVAGLLGMGGGSVMVSTL